MAFSVCVFVEPAAPGSSRARRNRIQRFHNPQIARPAEPWQGRLIQPSQMKMDALNRIVLFDERASARSHIRPQTRLAKQLEHRSRQARQVVRRQHEPRLAVLNDVRHPAYARGHNRHS